MDECCFLSPRRPQAAPLQQGLLIAAPFVMLALVSLAVGRNAYRHSLPVWSDELDYWRNLFT